jgi:exopolysaccharide/PEP-CTERM locus tyrosine autokinase
VGKFSKALDKASQVDSSPVRVEAGTQKEPESETRKKLEPQSSQPAAKSQAPSPSLASGSWDERLSLATTVTGPIAENFRTLRTRILHPDSGKVPRSLLVTSATPGEGKSFVCANLGIALAQGMDNYSLIVDCDLRKPALHQFFGLPLDRGLVNFLRDGDDLSSMIVPSGVDTLSLLPAGSPPVNPAELLGSANMIRLVDELESRYDDRILILDSSPMQAASETAILAQHVDGVILVVRWGGARREYVQKLVERIGHDRIIGIVFNAYKENVLDSKVFGSYGYKYDYAYKK